MRRGLKVVGYVAGGVLLTLAAIQWLERPTVVPEQPSAPAAAAPEPAQLPPRRGLRPLPPPPVEQSPKRLAPSAPATPVTPPKRSTTHYAGAAWEQQIDKVLTSQEAVETQSQQLQAVFNTLPAEGQVEAAGHLANLTADENYTLGNLLSDERTPVEALQVLMTDLTHRPDSIRLPVLVQLAQAPNHPLRAEALEDLTFLLQEDHGTDWAAWQAAVQRSLSSQAAER